MSTNTTDNIRKVTTSRLVEMKARGEKISMLTAYDYPQGGSGLYTAWQLPEPIHTPQEEGWKPG